jgi:hypothetical protein
MIHSVSENFGPFGMTGFVDRGSLEVGKANGSHGLQSRIFAVVTPCDFSLQLLHRVKPHPELREPLAGKPAIRQNYGPTRT